ncbi:MAG: DNA-processing protein DprA [Clostridia bacterium]|nr:DNA-processing protein DprA [Clostridia bacterium]
MDSNLYWVWLSEALGPASDCFIDLLEQFKSAEGIYRTNRDDLDDIPKLRPSVITSLLDKDLRQAQRIIDRCESIGVGILPFSDALYPDRLRNIHRPPVLLYYRGFVPDFPNRLAIAVVGTRGMTEEGRKNGYRIAYELAIAGAVVVSGMAIGIDGIAHVGALDAGGVTVAVLGSAIDYPYPQEHRAIYEKLIRQGGVISEYPPGMRTQRWHFPQRNRIIAGLCQGTLIVEAGENSGALITAKEALSQGRNLFAMPGDAANPSRVGTNNLIKAGAVPVTETADILQVYKSLYKPMIHPENLSNPAYFTGYDDTLRYGQQRISEYRSTAQPQPIPTPEYTDRQEDRRPADRSRTAPQAKPLREIPYTAEDTSPMLEQTPPTESAKAPMPAPATEKTAAPKTESTPKESQAPAAESVPQKLPDGLTDEQIFVLSMIRQGMSFDEMCKCGIKAAHLLVDITYLELVGCIRALPGGRYEQI